MSQNYKIPGLKNGIKNIFKKKCFNSKINSNIAKRIPYSFPFFVNLKFLFLIPEL